MSVPHTLLGLLDRQPNHGYDLERAYDERFSFRRPLQFGQVYATLGRLERDRPVRDRGRRRRRAGADHLCHHRRRAGRVRELAAMTSRSPP
jgi:DNA-binding PadR family transcriptional regulator